MDEIDRLRECPYCDGRMLLTYDGFICGNCFYVYYMDEGDQTIYDTARRFNAERDEIARTRDLEGGR